MEEKLADIDYWLLCDELTVVQASLLVAGHDPTAYEENVERWAYEKQPKRYSAVKTAIMMGIKKTLIKGELKEDHENHHEPFISPHLSTVDVESLKEWMLNKGFDNHFLYFPEEKNSEVLDKEHPRFSPKLAAALKAWSAFDDIETLKGNSPKTAVRNWLLKNAHELNLCKKNETPSKTAIEEIAKIVNWKPQGGAPETPLGKEQDKKPNQIGQFAVKKQAPLEETANIDPYDPDDLPF